MAAYLHGMDRITEIQRLLDAAWDHALPGREAAERNALLRSLTRGYFQTSGISVSTVAPAGNSGYSNPHATDGSRDRASCL